MPTKRHIFILSVALSTAIASTPAPARADDYATGVRYYSAHDYQRAADYFEAAMRANPANSSALYYDASSYEALGQHERARALFQLLLSVFPRSQAAGLAQRALAALHSGKVKSMVVLAEPVPAAPVPPSAVAADGPPPEIKAINDKLEAAQKSIDSTHEADAERAYIDAQHMAERLGGTHPKLGEVLAKAGDFYANKGDTTRAIQLYRRELAMDERIHGRNSEATADRMTVQANAYIMEGDYGQAEDLLRRSIDIYSRSAESAQRNHLNAKLENDKMIGAMGALAGVLRKAGRAGDAKVLEGQIRMMQQ